jgi:hypothetical protein
VEADPVRLPLRRGGTGTHVPVAPEVPAGQVPPVEYNNLLQRSVHLLWQRVDRLLLAFHRRFRRHVLGLPLPLPAVGPLQLPLSRGLRRRLQPQPAPHLFVFRQRQGHHYA